MEKLSFVLLSVLFLISGCNKQDNLVDGGKSNYLIVIPAKVIEIQAAKVFQDYIQRISGAVLPITSDVVEPTDNETLIGNVNRYELRDIPVSKLGKDGLYIKTTDKKLLFAGGTEKGILYGVYTFLEKYMGCRKYKSTVTIVPKQKTIVLNAINDIQIPSFDYRDDFYPDVINDAEYMAWHKLDNCHGPADQGNVWERDDLAHTLRFFVSTKEYGETHPEYFSFYDGRRHPGASVNGHPEAQLCLSNPEVLEIVWKNLEKEIAEKPMGDRSFCEDFEGWTKLTKNIFLWDYVVQYRNLISPFPNLHTLQPNLKYLHDNGIQIIFEEGNPETGGEFHELKAYLLAKLMWDVNIDLNGVMNDFLNGYYDNAGKYIREYIDLLQASLLKSGVKLGIYGTPVEEKNSFLTDSLIMEYNKIFDRAEKAVAGSPELLDRVRVASLPVSYAMLEFARDEKTGKRGAFINGEGNKLIPRTEIVTTLYDFVHLCIQTKVSHIREGRVTPQQYLDAYTKFLEDPPAKWAIPI